MAVDPIHDLLLSVRGEEPTTVASSSFTRLGKDAAELLVGKGIPMNTTISKMASENKLNPEQVRRVVEAANNAAFNTLFQESPSYVTFPVADSKEILNMKEHTKTASPVSQERGISLNISNEEFTRIIFGNQETVDDLPMDKTASQMQMIDKSRRIVEALLEKKASVLSKLAELQDAISVIVRKEEDTTDNIAAHLAAVGVQDGFIKVAMSKAGSYTVPNTRIPLLRPEMHPMVKLAAAVMEASRSYLYAKNRASSILSEYADELD